MACFWRKEGIRNVSDNSYNMPERKGIKGNNIALIHNIQRDALSHISTAGMYGRHNSLYRYCAIDLFDLRRDNESKTYSCYDSGSSDGP